MSKIAICPGSFNPITLGHLDIIKRASKMFDHVIVAVLQNSSKVCDFSVEERVEMIKHSIKGMENVSADAFNGLLAEYTKEKGATVIVKGLRAVSDFEYEFQMALANQRMNPAVETVFLTTNAEFMFLSSSVVREIATHGGDITEFVPEGLAEKITEKYNGGNKK